MTKDRHDIRASMKNERFLLWIVFLISALCFGTGMAVIAPALVDRAVPTWVSVVSGALAGAAFGAGMTWFIARVWTRSGGYTAARSMQTAIRTRRLPPDADPGKWSTLLDRHERDAGRTWWYVAVLCVLAGLYLVIALTNALPNLKLSPWLGVALFAGVAIYAPFEARSRRSAIHDLRKQLGEKVIPTS